MLYLLTTAFADIVQTTDVDVEDTTLNLAMVVHESNEWRAMRRRNMTTLVIVCNQLSPLGGYADDKFGFRISLFSSDAR